MLKTIFFNFIIYIWFVLWTPFLLVGLVSSKLERSFILADAWGVLFLARIIAGIKYEIHYPVNNENGIPLQHNVNSRLDGRAIIASKHMSVLEVGILVTHIPNAFFIMKRELLWIPIYGWAFARIGLIGVNRKRGATNMNILVNKVTKNIMKGMTLIIFPEGTRVYPNQNVPLKRGLLFLASNLKLPIMPVGVDTGLYWPKRGKIKSGTTHIYFEPEIPSSASLEEIRQAINKHSC
ncbi:MAG: 1-acyl-sn-glycerol-3-phosphate acyltransferase [Alphaproteobacteria bacterium]|jgi:1-acyl-sn-glycerol-3-phosphate acyltransferase|nr:1-acyl-sn-glycerol-3-phosphate acyltransferase [Alphaproteobacteria bacterium]